MFTGANKIKVKTICVFQNDSDIFVSKAFDSIKNDFYYRPIGGTVEFGEYTNETITREIKEEINAEIENIKLQRVIENIFSCEGLNGHEIMFVYSGDFCDKAFYEKKRYKLIENNGEEFEAEWINIHRFINNELRLVPEELHNNLLDIIKRRILTTAST